MQRRHFMRQGTVAAGAALLGLSRLPYPLYAADKRKQAQDVVTLGQSGLRVTPPAQGTGTSRVGKPSNQTPRLGERGPADLLLRGDDNGLYLRDLPRPSI